MKTKSFDCVKMKQEAQRACEEEYRGLSLEERKSRMMADIMATPEFAGIYGRFFESDAECKVAETQTPYKTASDAE